MTGWNVCRLLQNPLGQAAPAGQRGDIVRIGDGYSTVYLTPYEYDRTSAHELRWLLARAAGTSRPDPTGRVVRRPSDHR